MMGDTDAAKFLGGLLFMGLRQGRPTEAFGGTKAYEAGDLGAKALVDCMILA